MSSSIPPTIPPSPPPSSGAFTAVIFGLVFAVFAFFSGMSLATKYDAQAASLLDLFRPSSAQPVSEVDLSEFWRVWHLMDEKFAAPNAEDIPTLSDRIEGAIKGMVGSFGDSYSIYLPPADASSFSDDISGNFSGVGMEVGMRNGMVTVIAPLPETPADRAGVLAGDVVARIDDVSTDGMGIDEAVRLIRGERGTEVVLTVAREGELELIDIPIVRDTITIPTAQTEERDSVFIISLYSFNALAEAKMQEALREYVRSGADKLILDLRGNPGGFLQSAVSISSFFLPTGKIIVTENFGDSRPDQYFRSHGRTIQDFRPMDMVVLVDGGSASASEIVAGALASHEIATVIGETTFGKGSVQELVELPSGAALKVTVARWLTPDGTSISDGGIEPDIKIRRTPQQRLDGEDPQLEAAVDYLLDRLDLDKYLIDPTDELLSE